MEVVAAARDIPAGETLRVMSSIVPAAEVGPDTFASVSDVRGRIAASDIAASQPITADMLEQD